MKDDAKGKPGPADSTDVSPRVARRERRRERSREEIVDATRRVLARDGLPGTTLDAVAREVGLTKAALYYYYPSKDALLFDAVYDILERQAASISTAVDQTADGGAALRAIIRETILAYAGRIDDFRAAYLHGQASGPGAVQVTPEQLAKIRPLNDRMFAGAARRLAARPGRADVDPRMMAFLANVSALGVLTLKGMVESLDDPLLYSDEQLIEGLARIFEAAADPGAS
jgi:AcrR family transcriptional regulator